MCTLERPWCQEKNVIFLLVTGRPIAHSGQFVCIPNCIGEFGTDARQPLVTVKLPE